MEDSGLKEIKLILPYPPTVNNMYVTQNNRRVLSSKAKAWKEECFYNNKQFIGEGLGDVPIKALIKVYPPDKRRRDADNIVKPILDIGTELGCYGDDRQIVMFTVIKKIFVRNGGFVEVIFSHLQDGVNDNGFYYLY